MIAIMCTELERLFDGGRPLVISPGGLLFQSRQTVQKMYLVTRGCLLLVRHTRSGERLVLHRSHPGSVVAEASAYAVHYHCDAVAPDGVEVSSVPKSRFLAALEASPPLAESWAASLARATQSARLKAEIRSLPRVAGRLDAWLDSGHALPEKGHIQSLAEELGVTREALYRELSKRRASAS